MQVAPVEAFAQVNTEEQLLENPKIEELCKHSMALRLVIDVFKGRTKGFDFRFSQPDIRSLLTDEALLQDYNAISKMKSEGQANGAAVLTLKIDFLLYYIVCC